MATDVEHDRRDRGAANEVDKLLWDQMATLPLYQKPTYIAYSSTVSGVEDNPTQAGPLWNASTWTVQ